MAFNRAALHPDWGAGLTFGERARRLWRWRQRALLLLVLIASAVATVSLVTNPPDKPPMSTSYLPDSHIGP